MRTIDQILREAWKEIERDHGIAIDTVDFRYVETKITAGDGAKLIGVNFNGKTLVRKEA